MAKNIVVCSDGTGNKGGYGADSNVFKIYQSLDLTEDAKIEQVAMYDHGVGTSSNPIWRTLGGAMGLGFKQNVMDGYDFLCRHYQAGDKIFLFGFSRGAATVRALACMVQVCGLIKFSECNQENEYNYLLKKAWLHYQYVIAGSIGKFFMFIYDHASYYTSILKQKIFGNQQQPNTYIVSDYILPINKCHQFDSTNDNKIHFLGIWDTVSALGFPEKMGQGMGVIFNVLNWLLKILGIINHKYQADYAVRQVYHALALDDNRVAFLPKVWQETTSQGVQVHQVWFAGAHSNVGGGYPRAGMSNVALAWMMKHASTNGLCLAPKTLQEVKAKANVDDLLYNPRDGLAALFRYTARDVAKLCHDLDRNKERKVELGNVCIHHTVFKRMQDEIKRKSSDLVGYAPAFLPARFKEVDKDGNPFEKEVSSTTTYQKLRTSILNVEDWRKTIFFLFGWLLGFLGIFSWSFWQNPPLDFSMLSPDGKGTLHHVAEIIGYFFPAMFHDLLRYIIADKPEWITGIAVLTGLLYISNKVLTNKAANLALNMRSLYLNRVDVQQSSGANDTKVPSWIHLDKTPTSGKLRQVLGWIFFICAVGLVSMNIAFMKTVHQNINHTSPQSFNSVPCSPVKVEVCPLAYWNSSGFYLEEGARYQVVMKNNVWEDASIKADAWGWKDWESWENIHIRLGSRLWARAPDQPLFQLMGAVDAKCPKGKRCPVQFSIPPTDKNSRKEKPTTFTFVAPASGELLTFANDWPFMLENNISPPLVFTIERLQH
ncbi:MAG: DUF2235 domain-containing protein [Magnetococcales bacterium]|nr:DUF2235 domain-containing protein [Magnetococcales bacterium]NGZ26794.1 DUF2235 domain-containing protein [Magnetococcales bacterium]